MSQKPIEFKVGDWVHVKSYNKFGAFLDLTENKKTVIVELENNDDCNGEWPGGVLFTTPSDIELAELTAGQQSWISHGRTLAAIFISFWEGNMGGRRSISYLSDASNCSQLG